MECKKYQEATPSSGKNHLMRKVRNSNLNCDSPFRLLPNISTPPSRMFKIRNPFESPLLERLHLPVCSPGLFAESSAIKDDKFLWTICDISHLKPAEIDTAYFQENVSVIDPQTENNIQDKISNFFELNAIVPSPAQRGLNKKKYECPGSDQEENEPVGIEKLNEDSHLISGNYSTMDISNISNDKEHYLPEDEYYKKLFDFESQSPNTSPRKSPFDSPVQFSPLRELEVKSFRDELDAMDGKDFKICGLSPITPENETSQRDNSKNQSTKESKSVCRLIFSEMNLVNAKDHDGTFGLDMGKETVPENTVIETELNSSVNSGIMSIDGVDKHSDYSEMDISLSNTPKTGLFTSQRKRLSDSFKDLHSSFSQLEEIREEGSINLEVKSGLLSEGSSDLGYYSTNVATAPSVIEKTWNNSQVFSSTPTKRKK